jgi:molybdopterin molybdotransferase
VSNGPIPFPQALQTMQRIGAAQRTASVPTPLRQARGGVLLADLFAPMALPSFDNSAMDGFALRGEDLARACVEGLLLAGEVFAGRAAALGLSPGTCLRITTGAALPAGADTVVIKENATLVGDRVRFAPGTAPGSNVRHAGEDVLLGSRVLQAGTTLGSAALGLAAALGLDALPVAKRPSVAVFTSGDELRPAGAPLQRGEIYDSNRVLLQSMLAEEGIDTLAWPPLPDHADRMAAALHDAAQAYDVIVTCGGVSAGEKDLLPGLLMRHGAVHFWKVAMRPGMPVLFGTWGRALLLGLPGNPVSVMATFRRLAVPLLDAMQGRLDRAPPLRARLLAPVRKTHARLEFRRGTLSCSADGVLGVDPHPATGSHQQRSAAESNALFVLHEEGRDFEPGSLVEVEPYGAILRR